MASIDEHLKECERLHGHLCAGQLLGVRMALLGCELVGIKEPRGADRKSFIVWVEIDRCMADAVGAVTGARLGKRSLKYMDYGKVAATFLNTLTGEAVRLAALDTSRALADERYPLISSRGERQFRAYREASDSELFKIERVRVVLGEMDRPGRPRSRLTCSKCQEGINDGREERGANQEVLCRPCAFGGYYNIPVE